MRVKISLIAKGHFCPREKVAPGSSFIGKFGSVLLLSAMAWVLAWGQQFMRAQTPPAFDDSAPDSMRLTNDHYELTFSKTNGAILALVDRSTGHNLTLGSRYGCLWGAVFPGSSPDFIGGCSYNNSGPNRFSYSWNAAQSRLTLAYDWAPGVSPHLDAVVTVTASADAFFDLQLTVNHGWSTTMQNALLPCDLMFADDAVQAGYGPFLMPGVRLKASFFAQNRTYVPSYPSNAAFADYLALAVEGGHLAFYAINPSPSPIQPAALGFVDDDTYHAHTFFAYHSLHTWVTSGETWTSPRVRVRVGQAPETTILAYRQENGMADYPSLTDKLGADLEALARAPLIKADAHVIAKPFRDWIADLDRLPSPALLHPVAFQPRGHDENYPDFLPPDPQWGTTADFLALVQAAHARGILVMPYTNPTWWDEESPTIQNLSPLTITDIAVLDEAGQPVYETYGSHGGYVVSPHVDFVAQRLDQLMTQWQAEVPVDCVFEDQIGARAWRRDSNPAAPSPQAYSDGWLAHTRVYVDRCLMTEMGWDRLAETEVGFHGSLLTGAREFDYANQDWGAGNWQPYPLALWLFHDKVLLYQHDLSHHTMSEDKGVLTWNLAFGTMLSYNWQWADNDPLNNPWLDLVGALQRAVLSRAAGRTLDDYAEINADVTQSTFGDLAVIANWHPTLTYQVDGHYVAPGGFLARTDGGDVLAGVFVNFFNANGLSAGEHYLVIERTPHVVTVRQPLGADTSLTVDAPDDWQPGETLHVRAFDRAGNHLGQAGFWMDGRKVTFTYRQQWSDQAVGYYELVNSLKVYLPLALRGDGVMSLTLP